MAVSCEKDLYEISPKCFEAYFSSSRTRSECIVAVFDPKSAGGYSDAGRAQRERYSDNIRKCESLNAYRTSKPFIVDEQSVREDWLARDCKADEGTAKRKACARIIDDLLAKIGQPPLQIV